MTISGWIILLLSVTTVSLLFVWCIFKVMCVQKNDRGIEESRNRINKILDHYWGLVTGRDKERPTTGKVKETHETSPPDEPKIPPLDPDASATPLIKRLLGHESPDVRKATQDIINNGMVKETHLELLTAEVLHCLHIPADDRPVLKPKLLDILDLLQAGNTSAAKQNWEKALKHKLSKEARQIRTIEETIEML